MEWLRSLYPAICNTVHTAVPAYWPGLTSVLAGFCTGPVVTEAYLPLMSCRAVGGNPQDAIPVAAAVLVGVAALRIFDDTADQDRLGALWEEVGPARAWNYGASLQLLSLDLLSRSPLHADLIRNLNRLIMDTYFLIAYGQERDMTGQTQTIEAYWRTIEHKNAYAFATACAAGAMVGSADVALVKACGQFGHHLGLAIQILNDMDSLWTTTGKSDVQQGKVTLPLLYGLATDHAERDELATLVAAHDFAAHGTRIKEILDHIQTRTYLMWAALTERDHALAAIEPCPDTEGKEALTSYLTAMFDDVDLVLAEAEVN